MNDTELSAAQATLNELDTEAASLRNGIKDGIEAARAINAKVRQGQAQLTSIETRAGSLRQAVKVALNAKAEAARLAAIEATKEAAKE
jgi:hypothetical protein